MCLRGPCPSSSGTWRAVCVRYAFLDEVPAVVGEVLRPVSFPGVQRHLASRVVAERVGVARGGTAERVGNVARSARAVGVTPRTVREFDAVIKHGDRHCIHAENGEELLQEALRLALLVVCVLPAFRERRRRLAYFTPRFQFEVSSVSRSRSSLKCRSIFTISTPSMLGGTFETQ